MQKETVLLQAIKKDDGCSITMACTPAEFITIVADLTATIIQKVTTDTPEANRGEVFADMLSAIAQGTMECLNSHSTSSGLDLTEIAKNIASDQELN